jgi:hypothetical protein
MRQREGTAKGMFYMDMTAPMADAHQAASRFGS